MKNIIISIALISLTAELASGQTATNEFSRKDRWEVYGLAQTGVIFNVFESNASLGGGGVGAAYNVWEHFAFRGDLAISAAKFDFGLFSGPEEDRWVTLYMANFSLDYNVLRTPVTPVVSLGLGIGWFSEGIGTTFDQNLGAGVRWDVNERWFGRLMFNAGVWENTGHDRKGWAAMGLSLAVGYKF